MDLSDNEKSLLKQVVDHFDKEDRAVRERQIRQWRKLKYMWAGFQRIWYSEVAHDWRVVDEQYQSSYDAAYYDKQVNVFRAYLESIIAALSVTVPSVVCFPDDADNPLDLQTAKAGDKIAELVYRHNNVTLLWLHALYIFCTEGMVACYSYPKEDEKYGTYEEPKTEQEDQEQQVQICPLCQQQIGSPILANQEKDEFMPDDDDVLEHNMLEDNRILCPQCLELVDPEYKTEHAVITRVVGTTTKPKTRQCMEVYGGLYVKIPNYAMKQSDIPYLIFSYETHYSNVVDCYPDLKNKFDGNQRVVPSTGGMYDPYERWGRLSPQYYSEYPINLVTVRNCWLRPSAFNVLGDKDEVKKLKRKFPDGCKVVLINQDFAEAENECLDDCWTLTYNPLSDYLHHDPLGSLLVSIQEITNDLISLTVQTIEHGIPQTFANPTVLNFEQYRQTEVTPGAIYPARPPAGKPMSDGFYEVKTATLSGEVLPFTEKIQEAGQLVSGALPSLFGGAVPGQGKTAAQYSMSRAQALQRLQTPWKMLTIWWKEIFGKVIPSFIKDTMDDEKFVMKDEQGNFINVFIKKAELEGKIGSIELEASEQLPISWAQKKDVVMQLLTAGNPLVMQAISAPENLQLIQEILGLNDFVLPGEDDREKQYEEIQQLVNSTPIDPNTPSVDVDPNLDNHQIEADICRGWLIGPVGRQTKIDNPQGYTNVMLHMKRHVDIHQALTAMASNQAPPPTPQPEQKMKPTPGVQNVPRNTSAVQ